MQGKVFTEQSVLHLAYCMTKLQKHFSFPDFLKPFPPELTDFRGHLHNGMSYTNRLCMPAGHMRVATARQGGIVIEVNSECMPWCCNSMRAGHGVEPTLPSWCTSSRSFASSMS